MGSSNSGSACSTVEPDNADRAAFKAIKLPSDLQAGSGDKVVIDSAFRQLVSYGPEYRMSQFCLIEVIARHLRFKREVESGLSSHSLEPTGGYWIALAILCPLPE